MTAAARPIRRTGARVAGVLMVLALAWILTGLAAMPGSAADPTPAATPDTSTPVTVRLVSLSPEVTRPGDTLTVVAQLENTGSADITAPVATFSVARYWYSTRSAFASWETLPVSAPLGTSMQAVELPEPLAAGTTTTVTFEVEANAFGLLDGQVGWGPRGFSVSVTGEGTDYPASSALGVLRSYLVWFPVADEEVTPVDVSVLVPVVGPAYDPLDVETSAAALEKATEKSGRLSKVLASTEGFPAVAWAADPAVMTATDGVDEPSTSSSASAWAQRALTAANGRELFALPTFDQDWSAYASAGLNPPARTELPAALSTWRTDLAWPAQAAPSTAALRLAAAADAPIVVTAPGSLPPDPDLSYTPTGLTTVSTSTGTVTALLPDAVLSAQLASPTQTSAAAARQRVIAELAVLSRERPAEVRSILLTVPRSWTPTPDVARAQLEGLSSVPWVRLMPVSTLLDAEVPDVSRTSPAATTNGGGELTHDQLISLEKTRDAVDRFAQVVPDPTALTTPINAAALAATSVAWRADPAGRTAAIGLFATKAAETTSSISVVSQSDFTLISSGSNLPIKVHNSLDQPATVTVSLSPDDPRLVAEEPVTLIVPAGSDATAKIAVRAVGRGNVTVTVQILGPDGSVIASPASIGVKVRADWENLGTAIVAGLLVVLLGGGIWRTIHRGRSDRRAPAEVVEQLEQAEHASPMSENGDSREQPHEH